MQAGLGHEKLRAYQQALNFVCWAQSVLAQIKRQAAVIEHLDRACESIVDSIANGNSRRGRNDRNRYFDVAVGSGLECAACMDVCLRKHLISPEIQVKAKTELRSIVRMVIGLRDASSRSVREGGQKYGNAGDSAGETFFSHERLDVYRVALDLVGWLDGFTGSLDVGARYCTRLDKASTGIVLNIAEGNGRFSQADHRRFVDVAHTCAMGVASSLDMLVARDIVTTQDIQAGKRILTRLVPLLLGLRGYLEGDS